MIAADRSENATQLNGSVSAPQIPSTSVRRIGFMRTMLLLLVGFFLIASLLIVAKMFSEHFLRFRTGHSPSD